MHDSFFLRACLAFCCAVATTSAAEPSATLAGLKELWSSPGRTGTSVVAHYVDASGSPMFTSFSKLTAQCIGKNPDTFTDTHGCPLLGLVWTGHGAATDPASLRLLMDHNRWSFSLSQCADGSFYYQSNRDNNPQDYTAAPRLAATALCLLHQGEETANHRRTTHSPPAHCQAEIAGGETKVPARLIAA